MPGDLDGLLYIKLWPASVEDGLESCFFYIQKRSKKEDGMSASRLEMGATGAAFDLFQYCRYPG